MYLSFLNFRERTTQAFLTGSFEPHLVVGIVDAQENAVTEAHIGDELTFFAMLDNVDSFPDGMYSLSNIVKIQLYNFKTIL